MSKVQAILEAATVLFSRKGYERTSIADIATLADVANGTVIYHYKSKENLLNMVAWSTFSALHRQLVLGVSAGRNGLDALERFITIFFDYVETRPEGLAIYLECRPLDAAGENVGAVGLDVRALRLRLMELLADCIRTGIRDGSIKEVDPVGAATGVAATLMGAAWFVLFNDQEVKRFRAETVAMARGRLGGVSLG